MAERVTAHDLMQLLHRHLIPDETKPAGVFASEIQAPGHSGRRADLIWWGATAASGRELVGYEVKVTRADLMAELSDLTKSDPWQRYCDRWYLVLPDTALADGLELPPTWGVLTPPSGRRTRSMTVVTKAPKLSPQDKTPALATLLNWMHWRHHNMSTRLETMRKEVAGLQAECDDLKLLAPTQHGQRRREQEVVARIVRALGVNHDGSLGYYRGTLDVEDVVAVLKDVAAANGLRAHAQAQLDSYRDQIRWLHQQIKRTLDETGKQARSA